MSKIFLLLLLGVGAALVVGGVLEVKVHPDKAAGVPNAVIGFVQDGAILEKSRAAGIFIKRRVEQIAIQDEAQRAKVAIGYVQTDSERLETLLSGKGSWDPRTLISQSKLLADSVKTARSQLEKLPEGEAAELQAEADEAFTLASNTLKNLQGTQTALEKASGDLTAAAALIEAGIGGDSGEVAGAKDDKAESSSPTPVIPLQF